MSTALICATVPHVARAVKPSLGRRPGATTARCGALARSRPSADPDRRRRAVRRARLRRHLARRIAERAGSTRARSTRSSRRRSRLLSRLVDVAIVGDQAAVPVAGRSWALGAFDGADRRERVGAFAAAVRRVMESAGAGSVPPPRPPPPTPKPPRSGASDRPGGSRTQPASSPPSPTPPSSDPTGHGTRRRRPCGSSRLRRPSCR